LVSVFLLHAANFVKTNIYFSAAESAFDSGKYEDAIKYYDKVIEADSGNAMAYLGKGLALDALGKYEEALEFSTKPLKSTKIWQKPIMPKAPL